MMSDFSLDAIINEALKEVCEREAARVTDPRRLHAVMTRLVDLSRQNAGDDERIASLIGQLEAVVKVEES
jgi:hypothetical protein